MIESLTILAIAGALFLLGRFLLQKRSLAKKTFSDNHAAKKSAERDLVGKALSSRPEKPTFDD